MTGLVQTSWEETRPRTSSPLIVSRDSFSPVTWALFQKGENSLCWRMSLYIFDTLFLLPYLVAWLFLWLFTLSWLLVISCCKRKGKTSDSVLWQKPYTDRNIQEAMWQHKKHTKTSITQRLRTYIGRSVGVTIATQLVWLYRFKGFQPSY